MKHTNCVVNWWLYGSNNQKWFGSGLASDGFIYCIPWIGMNILQIDSRHVNEKMLELVEIIHVHWISSLLTIITYKGNTTREGYLWLTKMIFNVLERYLGFPHYLSTMNTSLNWVMKVRLHTKYSTSLFFAQSQSSSIK